MLIGVCLQWCVAGLGTGSWKSAQFVGIGTISSKQDLHQHCQPTLDIWSDWTEQDIQSLSAWTFSYTQGKGSTRQSI